MIKIISIIFWFNAIYEISNIFNKYNININNGSDLKYNRAHRFPLVENSSRP